MQEEHYLNELKSMYEISLDKLNRTIEWEFENMFPYLKGIVKYYEEKKVLEHKLHHLNVTLGTEELEDDE